MRFSSFPRLYIDCTSDRTICSVNQRVLFNEATAIARHPNTETVLAVGDEAASLGNAAANSVEVLWPLVCGRIADSMATVALLQLFLRRSEHSFSAFNRLLGITGRIAHTSIVSPAQLHTWNGVLRSAGLQGLVLTPRSQAISVKVRETQHHAQFSVCEISSDNTELTTYVGGTCIQVRQIRWGMDTLHSHIQKVVTDELHFAISKESANQILERLINCVVLFDTGERAKTRKISLKGKELNGSLSKTFIVSNSIFAKTLADAFKPLTDGLQEFFEQGAMVGATSFESAPMYLAGLGENIAGLESYLADVLQTDVIWLSEPKFVVQQGLVLLDK